MNSYSPIHFITLSLVSIIHKIDNVVITVGNNEVQETHLNASYNSHADIKLHHPKRRQCQTLLLARIWF